MNEQYEQDDQHFYDGRYPEYDQQNFRIGETFPQDTQFGQFDYSYAQPGGYGEPVAYVSSQHSQYTGQIFTPVPGDMYTPQASGNGYDDEPPLLEELGINFDHIVQKTLAVLNPLTKPDTSIMQDTDLAGPLVFCLAFGGSLLLSGKVHFGYIYGIGVVGCLAMYALLNLMSMTGVSAGCTVSILGYCLLPMALLSSFAILISLKGLFGIALTTVAVLWCSMSASKLFVAALAMDQQQLLVAYPCVLVYGVFALLTVF